MRFFVDYTLPVGPVSGRGVDTPAEALAQYRALRSAGAGAVQIRDETGKVYSLTDLLMLASPSRPGGLKDRPEP